MPALHLDVADARWFVLVARERHRAVHHPTVQRGLTMTVVVLSTAPSRVLYERVAGVIDTASNMPDGLILHTATEVGDGSVRIIDVWETRDEAEYFAANRLAPAIAVVAEGLDADQPPPASEREILEPFDLILP
jgi:hypothetical protein